MKDEKKIRTGRQIWEGIQHSFIDEVYAEKRIKEWIRGNREFAMKRRYIVIEGEEDKEERNKTKLII